MENKIIDSKVLKLRNDDEPDDMIRFYQKEGFVVVKMEKLGDCLWFHLVRYED